MLPGKSKDLRKGLCFFWICGEKRRPSAGIGPSIAIENKAFSVY